MQTTFLDRWLQSVESPWTKFQRLFATDRSAATPEDWRYVFYTLILFIVIIPGGVFMMSGMVQIFQDNPTEQVQGKSSCST